MEVLGLLAVIGFIYLIFKFIFYTERKFGYEFFTFKQGFLTVIILVSMILTRISYVDHQYEFTWEVILNLMVLISIVIYQYICIYKKTNWYIALAIIILQLITYLLLILLVMGASSNNRSYYYDYDD